MDYRFSSAFANLAPSAIREILKNAGDPSVIAFAAGNPNAASFPLEDIRQLTSDKASTTRSMCMPRLPFTKTTSPSATDWLK